MADSFMKNIKYGKMPFQKDNIARYGQGFSNLLQMAAITGTPHSAQQQHRTVSVQHDNMEDSIMIPGEEADMN